MRALVQRVSSGRVVVGGSNVGEIGVGLLVLLGVTHSDSDDDARVIADKVVGLRIFPDGDGLMNRSVHDVGGAVLLISQFTLYGDSRRGRRPSFTGAADPTQAEPLVRSVATYIEESGVPLAQGVFGALMDVSSVNHGPVTIMLESELGRLI